MRRNFSLIILFLVLLGISFWLVGRPIGRHIQAVRLAEKLCAAVQTGNAAQVNALLKDGADVNTRCRNSGDNYGKTMLNIAITQHHAPIVKLLLDKGADPTLGDDRYHDGNGYDAYYYAAGYGDVHSFAYLFAQADDERRKDSLGDAVGNDNCEVVAYILDHGVNPHTVDINGDTPLHFVRSPRVAQLLIVHGEKVNVKNLTGETPLHVAYSVEVAKELLRLGANPTVRNKAGLTPLDSARRRGKDQVVKLLSVYDNKHHR